MKKKIALLLALIMTISLMPVTIFAGSENRVSRYDYNVPSQSLYVLSVSEFNAGTSLGNTFVDNGVVKDLLLKDDRYRSYAQWRSDRKTVRIDGGLERGRLYEAPKIQMSITDSYSQTINNTDAFNLTLENAVWTAWLIRNNYGTNNDIPVPDNIDFNLMSSYGGAWSTVSAQATTGSSSGTGWGKYFSSPNWYTIKYDGKGASDGFGNIAYTLTISRINPNVATIGIDYKWDDTATPAAAVYKYSKDDTIAIPTLMTVTDDSKDIVATMSSNNSPFTSGNFLVASARSGGTTNTVKSVKTGRDRINLDSIIITENRPGIINNTGLFEISAPTGYEFNSPANWTFRTDLGLTHSGASSNNGIIPSSSIQYLDSTTSYRYSRESYYIRITGFDTPESRYRAGILTIDGIVLVPIDDKVTTGEELKVTIKTGKDIRNAAAALIDDDSVPSSTFAKATTDSNGFTSGDITVAKAVDFSIQFSAPSKVPDLVSARWDYASVDSESSIHAAARVTFKELEISAWRSERPTTFTLPEGVQIRRIVYNTKTNISTTLNNVTIFNKDMSATDVEVSRYINGTSATYYGNSFTLRDIAKDRDASTNQDKITTLEFTLYLSISPEFEGPVTLEVSGGGIPGDIELEPIVIANVVKPIEIITETTYVDIGYQQYSVDSITIKENVAGALKRNEELEIALIDKTGTRDLRFSTIANSQIQRIDGNIEVSSLKYTNGTIGLMIDRASTTPSTIKINDLVVRITRDVPYGSYDLVVYGDAVYNNYSYDHDFTGTYVRSNDRLGTSAIDKISTLTGFSDYGFIKENYIQVGTYGATDVVKPAPSASSKIMIYPGSTTVYIDGEAKVVDPAPINDNGTIYIPLRFFSETFGMVVAWDSGTATGTIKSDNKTIVVTIGNSVIFVDGVPVTMTDIGGSPVTPKVVNDKILVPMRAFFNGVVGLNQDAIQWKDFYAEIN